MTRFKRQRYESKQPTNHAVDAGRPSGGNRLGRLLYTLRPYTCRCLAFGSRGALFPVREKVHRVLAVVVAGLGCFAILAGYRRHRRIRVLLLLGGGLALIFAGAYFGNRLPSHLAEVAVTMTGSCFMIAGHFLNHTFCRDCERCKNS